jgi:hypothetical protein
MSNGPDFLAPVGRRQQEKKIICSSAINIRICSSLIILEIRSTFLIFKTVRGFSSEIRSTFLSLA